MHVGKADQGGCQLEKSLAALKIDCLDLYLLREAMPADARRDDLGAFLEDQVGRGRIRYFGVGSAFSHLQNDLGQFPVAYRVFQFDDDPIRQNMSALASVAERGIITSGSLKASQPLIQAAAVHPELTRRHSEQAGLDLADPQIVWRLLL